MANLLQLLLGGQSQAGRVGTPGIGDGLDRFKTDGDMDIPVMGSRLPVREVPPETREVPVQSRRQTQQDPTPELIKRKGMFGIGGTLRDALGLLGDSLLVGTGGKAVYRPQRDAEKLGSAQYGFTDDPDAAAERMTELPNGVEAGRELYQNTQNNLLKNKQLESLDESRDALTMYRQSQGELARLKQAHAEELAAQKLAWEREKLGILEGGRNRRDNPPAAPRETPALEAIRRKVAASGYDSLTEGQRRLYDDDIAPRTKGKTSRVSGETPKPRIDVSKFKRVSDVPMAQ